MKINKMVFLSVLGVAVCCCLFNPAASALADSVAITNDLSAAHKALIADNSIISWGVNPNTQERTPEPPAGGDRLLKAYNGMFVGDTTEKKVYFTFDLGYESGYTAEVLDILKENNIKGIFFLCGNYLKQTDLINRMISEGHSIGNHTDKHKDLPVLSEEAINKDITDLQNGFTAQYPDTPLNYFRPPQGRISEKVLKLVNAQNLKTVMWSIAIVDWGKTPIDAAASANKIASRLHPGAIMLCHITNSGTPKMLRLLIPQITEKGYIIGNAGEL